MQVLPQLLLSRLPLQDGVAVQTLVDHLQFGHVVFCIGRLEGFGDVDDESHRGLLLSWLGPEFHETLDLGPVLFHSID